MTSCQKRFHNLGLFAAASGLLTVLAQFYGLFRRNDLYLLLTIFPSVFTTCLVQALVHFTDLDAAVKFAAVAPALFAHVLVSLAVLVLSLPLRGACAEGSGTAHGLFPLVADKATSVDVKFQDLE